MLARLLDSAPTKLQSVSKGPGIYALYDHEAKPRYIGITERCLRDRIYSRHTAGDGNSHKFSSIYNAGRMFHSRGHPAICSQDGPIAKELRRLFTRAHCSAVAIPLTDVSMKELRALEVAVLAFAPEQATRWNHVRALEPIEPTELVASFVATLAWPRKKLDAIERQSQRWWAHGLR